MYHIDHARVQKYIVQRNTTQYKNLPSYQPHLPIPPSTSQLPHASQVATRDHCWSPYLIGIVHGSTGTSILIRMFEGFS